MYSLLRSTLRAVLCIPSCEVPWVQFYVFPEGFAWGNTRRVQITYTLEAMAQNHSCHGALIYPRVYWYTLASKAPFSVHGLCTLWRYLSNAHALWYKWVCTARRLQQVVTVQRIYVLLRNVLTIFLIFTRSKKFSLKNKKDLVLACHNPPLKKSEEASLRGNAITQSWSHPIKKKVEYRDGMRPWLHG